MKLQQATRYALWAVVELASRANEQVRAQELAKRYNLSQNHLVRVLHALTKAKIVKSARGPGGGFTFCANANRLTVYDIICLFETGWPNEERTEHEQATAGDGAHEGMNRASSVVADTGRVKAAGEQNPRLLITCA